MLTSSGHHKLPGQAKDVVVHVKLNVDGNGSFIWWDHHLQQQGFLHDLSTQKTQTDMMKSHFQNENESIGSYLCNIYDTSKYMYCVYQN